MEEFSNFYTGLSHVYQSKLEPPPHHTLTSLSHITPPHHTLTSLSHITHPSHTHHTPTSHPNITLPHHTPTSLSHITHPSHPHITSPHHRVHQLYDTQVLTCLNLAISVFSWRIWGRGSMPGLFITGKLPQHVSIQALLHIHKYVVKQLFVKYLTI